MKQLNIFLPAVFFLIFISGKAGAQQRFKAGAVAGLNASQIMGDDTGGYNKLGLLGGLRVVTTLKDNKDISLEMLYSQRGSYDKYGSPKCFNGALEINLQYVEVPVVFNLRDWYMEEGDFYRVAASAGLVYSRLISAKSEGSCHDTVTDLFNSNDYGFTAGVEYFFNRHLGLGVRWTRSFNLLFDHDKHENQQGRNSLRGYFFSFRTAYMF